MKKSLVRIVVIGSTELEAKWIYVDCIWIKGWMERNTNVFEFLHFVPEPMLTTLTQTLVLWGNYYVLHNEDSMTQGY